MVKLITTPSCRHPWWVLAFVLVLSAGSAVYAARHFAIKTDINQLISDQLPWTQRAKQYMAAFPQREILAVVDAPTPELVEQATTKLSAALQSRRDLIRAVRQPQSGSFFERNGLLFLSTEEVVRVTDGLTRADALLAKCLVLILETLARVFQPGCPRQAPCRLSAQGHHVGVPRAKRRNSGGLTTRSCGCRATAVLAQRR